MSFRRKMDIFYPPQHHRKLNLLLLATCLESDIGKAATCSNLTEWLEKIDASDTKIKHFQQLNFC